MPSVPSISRRQLRYLAADSAGVREVRASFGRVGRRGRCRFVLPTGRTTVRSGRRAVGISVAGAGDWQRIVTRLRPGSYLIGLRATDGRDNRTRGPRAFSVRVTR